MRLLVYPMDDANQAPRQQGNIEYVRSVAFFRSEQEVEQQSGQASHAQSFGHLHIARAKAARAASMHKDDECTRRIGYAERPN
jgi:hypothetical protein